LRSGSVENLVGYVRRNALVPYTRSFASLEALNAHLRAWCERERSRHAAAWEVESAALSGLPKHPFSPSVSRPVVVNKTSLVTVDRVRYSVPVTHVGRRLQGECLVERVEVFDGSVCVAAHTRSYVKGATVLHLGHYLDAFERKPNQCKNHCRKVVSMTIRVSYQPETLCAGVFRSGAD
jgi:hypothetical protein